MVDNVWDTESKGIQKKLSIILILLIFKLLTTTNANVTVIHIDFNNIHDY